MEDQNDKLGGFFRKKLNVFDGEEDWDRPGPEVWEQASQRFQATPYTSNNRVSLLWIDILVLMLLLSGSYIASLQKHQATLQKALIASQQTSGDSPCSDDEPTREWEQEIACWEAAHQQATKMAKQWEKEAKALNQRLAVVTAQMEVMETEAALNVKAELSSISQKNNITPQRISYPYSFQPIKRVSHPITMLSALPINPDQMPDFQDGNLAKRRQEIEFGLHTSLLSMDIPLKSDFEGLDKATDEVKLSKQLNLSRGIRMGFSLRPRFYVHTGFQIASISNELVYREAIIYDKSGEYTRPDGGTGNDLTLARRSPFSSSENHVKVGIPEDTDLKTGDLMVATISENTWFRYLKVPLSLSYFLGDGRLTWQVQAGGQWNKMMDGKSSFSMALEAKDKLMEIEKIELQKEEFPAKSYLSATGGLGMNYQLSRHWHTRASFQYAYHFISQQTDVFKNSPLTSRNLRLGLYYRF